MIIAPKDATGCFDLLRVEQIRTIQESKGMPRGINACRIKVLHGMERHVKTAGKVSKGSFKYTLENTIGGIGQGAGSGTQDGNDDIGLIKDVYADTTPGFTFQHPSGAKEEEDTRHGPGFIDDQIDVTELDTNDGLDLGSGRQPRFQPSNNKLYSEKQVEDATQKLKVIFAKYRKHLSEIGDRSSLNILRLSERLL